MNQPNKKSERSSSIEILRIFAMIAIVTCHVTASLAMLQTSGGLHSDASLPYYINFTLASSDPSMWALVFLQSIGQWGNAVFVICSAWFLCASGTARLSKITRLVLDVFIVSITILAVALIFGLQMQIKDIVRCFFPITFTNNWFITCYLLLYIIHPALNWVFEKLGKRGHAALALALFFLYMLIPIVKGGFFYSNNLVVMITEYSLVAFGRYYLVETLSSKRANLHVFLVGTLGAILAILLLEQLGLRVDALSDQMLHFCNFRDPLLFMSAFGAFNLVRNYSYKNSRINQMSSLMLLVYLIHENYIFSHYLRPAIWPWIYDMVGYDLLFVWIALFVFVLFSASVLLAFLYGKTLGKLAALIEPKLTRGIRNVGNLFVDGICALK